MAEKLGCCPGTHNMEEEGESLLRNYLGFSRSYTYAFWELDT